MTKITLESTAGILMKTFSDHQPYFKFLNTHINKVPTPKLIKSVIKVNRRSRMLKIANPIANPNVNYNTLISKINHSKITHMPNKIAKFKKNMKSTWITSGIIKSIKYRDRFYQKVKFTNPNITNYVIRQTNLKTYKNILKKT